MIKNSVEFDHHNYHHIIDHNYHHSYINYYHINYYHANTFIHYYFHYDLYDLNDY